MSANTESPSSRPVDEWSARAAQLDNDDPLASAREKFLQAPGVLAYLDGNSLGRPVESVVDRASAFIRTEWGTRLIRSWDEKWMELPTVIGDRIGRITLGAAAGQTVVADSTTVLLYKLIRAAVARDRSRSRIVVDDDNFPTDRFVVEGIAAEFGLTIEWIRVDRAAGVTPEMVGEVLSDQTALVLLSHVSYRSGFLCDVPGITRIAHDAGALVLWDLCHSVGVVPMELDEWGVDIAVGCTYKYLNGGPGSPAFVYVRDDLQRELVQPIHGWMGARSPFEMGDRYQPSDGIRRFISGTPPVQGMLAMNEMLNLIETATLPAIRTKSLALTEFAIELADAYLSPLGARLATPRSGSLRGSHVTVSHALFGEVTNDLWKLGVIPDYRAPDGIRIGLSPLSTSFGETLTGMAAIRDSLAERSSR